MKLGRSCFLLLLGSILVTAPSALFAGVGSGVIEGPFKLEAGDGGGGSGTERLGERDPIPETSSPTSKPADTKAAPTPPETKAVEQSKTTTKVTCREEDGKTFYRVETYSGGQLVRSTEWEAGTYSPEPNTEAGSAEDVEVRPLTEEEFEEAERQLEELRPALPDPDEPVEVELPEKKPVPDNAESGGGNTQKDKRGAWRAFGRLFRRPA